MRLGEVDLQMGVESCILELDLYMHQHDFVDIAEPFTLSPADDPSASSRIP
jgi:hypothetical protein